MINDESFNHKNSLGNKVQIRSTGEAGLDEDGREATATRLARPFGIDFDREGNLFVSDTLNSRIVRVLQ